jgi:hypothetical protein
VLAVVFTYSEVAERRRKAAAEPGTGVPETHEPGDFPLPPMDLVVPPSPRLRARVGAPDDTTDGER